MTENDQIERWLAARPRNYEQQTVLNTGTLVGEWRVRAFLGAGLSAEVYLVTNSRFGHRGALKVLLDESRGLKERFLAEQDALRFLSIRALPRFMGSGSVDGHLYYVMEYLRPLPDPMSPRDIPSFMNRVAKAVQMLHEAGYIHRDLKPANILMRDPDEPVLIDLGLIKRRGTGGGPSFSVRRGISIVDGKVVGVGTLDFAAPEQLLKGEASVQSDIFALGKLLRYFYEGRPPHSIQTIIRRATREIPNDRYASANDFALAIRHRNYGRFVMAFLLSAALLAGVTFPFWRASLAPIVVPILRPARPVLVVKPRADEDSSQYLQRVLPLASAGNPAAQMAVAEAYFYGRGTATNRAEAVAWYKVAAESGEGDAMASLGLCAYRGWGCTKDAVAAVSWWRKAADRGCLSAMSDLAFCMMHGIGTTKDEVGAFQLALKAAECGFAPAQTFVGECYLEGMGVEMDIERSETWLYRASRQGNARAQMLLRTR